MEAYDEPIKHNQGHSYLIICV